MNKRTKKAVKPLTEKEPNPRLRSGASSPSERIDRRDYGEVLVKTLRSGVTIEQLMPERTEKKKNDR